MDRDEIYDDMMEQLPKLCDRSEPTICQQAQYVEDNRRRYGLPVEDVPTVH